MRGLRLFSVARLGAFGGVHHLIVGIDELELRARFHGAEEDDAHVALEDVLQERLVHPDGENRTRAVADERLENLETRPAGGAHPAALHPAADGHLLAGFEGRDRLQMTAIFIAQRKPVEEVFDGGQADALEICRAPRSNAFQKLKWCLQVVGGHLLNDDGLTLCQLYLANA